MTVSTHSSRPPISDSHSQIADCFDVLALVRSDPVTCVRDRSRSRRIRTPFARRPGSRAHLFTLSWYSSAPSTMSGDPNSQSSKDNGKRTSSPDKSRQPGITAFRSLRP